MVMLQIFTAIINWYKNSQTWLLKVSNITTVQSYGRRLSFFLPLFNTWWNNAELFFFSHKHLKCSNIFESSVAGSVFKSRMRDEYILVILMKWLATSIKYFLHNLNVFIERLQCLSGYTRPRKNLNSHNRGRVNLNSLEHYKRTNHFHLRNIICNVSGQNKQIRLH